MATIETVATATPNKLLMTTPGKKRAGVLIKASAPLEDNKIEEEKLPVKNIEEHAHL